MALDPWYITGFADGDGSFTFSRNGRGISLYFSIKCYYGERPLLQQIQAFFGAGSLYEVKKRTPKRQGDGYTKTACYYRVSMRAELDRIVEHFDQYPPQGTRAASYQIWRQMWEIKRKGPNSYEELDALAQKLSALSPRNQPWC